MKQTQEQMTVYYAPQDLAPTKTPWVFLAGSIEMGAASAWQQQIIDALGKSAPITVLNPRRLDWDASWTQEAHSPQFREQVLWELEGLTQAHWIVFYFDPATKSPVSLLELGLWAQSGKCVVCAPAGFWRKGNVDIVCSVYGVPQCETLEDLIEFMKNNILQK